MSVDDSAVLTGEAASGPWQRLSAGDHLAQGPNQVGPGNVPAGGDLSLEIGWDRFEQLLVHVSRDVLGLADVRFRRYGTQGQKQHGIDLAGRHADGTYTVVQCKEYETFAASDLRAAVETFAKGRRPFDAKHFVVAVSQPTRVTQLEEELATLQDENEDLHLEVWGAEQINDILRDRADIVARFWTRETADTFCTGAPLPGVAAADPDWIRLTERVLLTPLGVEGVEDQLREADRTFTDDPGAAAATYALLAQRVGDQGFRGHSHVLRRKQLDALEKAGLYEEFAELSAGLAAIALHEGDLDTARVLTFRLDAVARKLAEPGSEAPAEGDDTRRVVEPGAFKIVGAHAELISAAFHTAEHPLGETGSLEAALRSDPDFEPGYRPLLVLLLAELTMATKLIEPTDQPIVELSGVTPLSSQELANRAVEALDSLTAAALAQARAAAQTPTTADLLLRLQLVRAWYDPDERRDLVNRARTLKIPRRQASMVLASQARRDALDGAAAEALEGYRAAVRCAIEDGRTEDARGWLYAIREVNVRYGPWTSGLDEEHLLAQALPAGTNRLIVRVRDPERDARVNALNKRANAAITATLRWLADSLVLGDTGDEQSAAELLGDLYAANREPLRAASAYQWAGRTTKLGELADAVGDLVLPTAPVGTGPYWQQLASLELLIKQQDLIDDEIATALLPVLTTLVRASRAGELVDDVPGNLQIALTKAACAFAGRGTADDAQALLDVFAVDVPRQENHYRHHDAEHVGACKSIAAHHPQLVLTALLRIVDLAEVGTDDALRALGEDLVQQLLRGSDAAEHGQRSRDLVAAADIRDEERGPLRERLVSMAATGRYQAGVALAALGGSAPEDVVRAEQARDRLLSRPEPDGMSVSFGTTMVPDSFQVTFLGVADQRRVLEKVLSIAEDPREAAQNRQDALMAACNLVIEMPEDVKRSVHEKSRSFALGEKDGSFLDAETSNPHPLSAARIDFGPVSLKASGLRLALWSSGSADEKTWVKDQAKGLLAEGDATSAHQAAVILSRLGDDLLSDLDPRLLANQKLPAVQQLAVVVAAAAPLQNEALLTSLAVDADATVRRLLAHRLHQKRAQLDEGPSRDAVSRVLGYLAADPRHSVRRAAAGQPS